MAQTLGIIDLIWKGKKLPIEQKTGKVKLGGTSNTPVLLNASVDRAGHFEASEITGVLPLRRGMRLMDMFDSGEGELQVICDTGQTYVWPDAFLTTRPEAHAGEGGKIEMKWTAGAPDELLA